MSAASKPTPAPKAPAIITGPQHAAAVIEEAGRPVHFSLIWEGVVARLQRLPKAKRCYNLDDWRSGVKTPDATLSAQIILSTKRDTGVFVRVGEAEGIPATYALRSMTAAQRRKSPLLPDRVKARMAKAAAPEKAAKKTGARKTREAITAEAAKPKRRRAPKPKPEVAIVPASPVEAPAPVEAPTPAPVRDEVAEAAALLAGGAA
jgi:hypothetical protein